jgi:hypothetical protein
MAVVAVRQSVFVLDGGLGPSHADSSPTADALTLS